MNNSSTYLSQANAYKQLADKYEQEYLNYKQQLDKARSLLEKAIKKYGSIQGVIKALGPQKAKLLANKIKELKNNYNTSKQNYENELSLYNKYMNLYRQAQQAEEQARQRAEEQARQRQQTQQTHSTYTTQPTQPTQLTYTTQPTHTTPNYKNIYNQYINDLRNGRLHFGSDVDKLGNYANQYLQERNNKLAYDVAQEFTNKMRNGQIHSVSDVDNIINEVIKKYSGQAPDWNNSAWQNTINQIYNKIKQPILNKGYKSLGDFINEYNSKHNQPTQPTQPTQPNQNNQTAQTEQNNQVEQPTNNQKVIPITEQPTNNQNNDLYNQYMNDLKNGVFHFGADVEKLGGNINGYIKARNKALVQRYGNIAKSLIQAGYDPKTVVATLEQYMIKDIENGGGINPYSKGAPAGYKKLLDNLYSGVKKYLGGTPDMTFSEIANKIKGNNNFTNNQDNNSNNKQDTVDIAGNTEVPNSTAKVDEGLTNLAQQKESLYNEGLDTIDNTIKKKDQVLGILDNVAKTNPDLKDEIDVLKQKINNNTETTTNVLKNRLKEMNIIEDRVKSLTGITEEQKQNILNQIQEYKQNLLNLSKDQLNRIKKYINLYKKGLAYRLGDYGKMLQAKAAKGKVGEGMAHASYLDVQKAINQGLQLAEQQDLAQRANLYNTVLNNYNAIVNQVKQVGAMYDPVIKEVVQSGYNDLKGVIGNINSDLINYNKATNTELQNVGNSLAQKRLTLLQNNLQQQNAKLTTDLQAKLLNLQKNVGIGNNKNTQNTNINKTSNNNINPNNTVSSVFNKNANTGNGVVNGDLDTMRQKCATQGKTVTIKNGKWVCSD